MSKKPQKQEITLMTLLANESTGPSRKLLKAYNKPDAENYEDLEIKLAELYYSVPDKIQIERELADIHPHKDWILKNISPSEIKTEAIPTENDIDAQLNNAQKELITISSPEADSSSFVGSETQKIQFKPSDLMGLLSIAGLIGVTFYTLIKRK